LEIIVGLITTKEVGVAVTLIDSLKDEELFTDDEILAGTKGEVINGDMESLKVMEAVAEPEGETDWVIEELIDWDAVELKDFVGVTLIDIDCEGVSEIDFVLEVDGETDEVEVTDIEAVTEIDQLGVLVSESEEVELSEGEPEVEALLEYEGDLELEGVVVNDGDEVID